MGIIFNLMTKHDIENKTKVLLKNYIDEAYHCLDNIESPGLKLALHEIMGKIFGQYI